MVFVVAVAVVERVSVNEPETVRVAVLEEVEDKVSDAVAVPLWVIERVLLVDREAVSVNETESVVVAVRLNVVVRVSTTGSNVCSCASWADAVQERMPHDADVES